METLKKLKGYSEEELQSIAQIAYYMMMQGKMQDAQTLFEGLVAIDPTEEYYYRALGVLAQKKGDSTSALRHFGYAIQLAPDQPQGFVNRAEIYLYLNKKGQAELDLQEALGRMKRADQNLSQKAWALFKHLRN